MSIITQINGVLWGWLLAAVLLSTGLYYSIGMKFPQIRFFGKSIASLKTGSKSEDRSISGFAALCGAVGAQVGTGSIVGVASALAAGGPGALFWMWVTALFGMTLSFGEATLAILFREKNPDGSYTGGAPYYMKNGLNNKILPLIYAGLSIFSIGFCIAMLQNNSIASAIANVTHIPQIVPGTVAALLASFIVLGGAKRITDFASKVVPFMAIGYILVTLLILITHIGQIPSVFSLIIKSAFSVEAAVGGAAGYTIKEAIRNGVARGLFSNDAGNGGAAGFHATATVKHPSTQGFSAMLGTFITTIIICSCTGFAILLTGAMDTGTDGIVLVQEAFGLAIGPIGKWIVLLAMCLFGFTTMIADIFYGEVGIRFIFKEKGPSMAVIYKVAAIIMVIFGSIISLPALWQVVDLLVGLIVIVNIIALLGLFKYVIYILTDYTKQLNAGVNDPVWDGKIELPDDTGSETDAP